MREHPVLEIYTLQASVGQFARVSSRVITLKGAGAESNSRLKRSLETFGYRYRSLTIIDFMTSCGRLRRTSEFRKRVTVSSSCLGDPYETQRVLSERTNASRPIALRMCFPEECQATVKPFFCPSRGLSPPPCNSGHRITASAIRDHTFGKSGVRGERDFLSWIVTGQEFFLPWTIE